MDHKKALDKIKKLLRLANSSNPHEAAAAMRQARALMEKHQLDQTDVDIADIEEHGTRSGSKMKPALWESRLAQTVAKAYSCRLFFKAGVGDWRFVGEMAEVASYTLAVLLRQVRQARRDYIAQNLKRCKSASKTKRADQFCSGWVYAVYTKVAEFAGTEPSGATDAYMLKHHPDLVDGKAIDRTAKTKSLSLRAINDTAAGIQAADSVQLNHGVGGQEQLALT
ncbi:DUF2786 domain-containing protein [Ectopseudomonas oleovorans]|uniref:Uncharacterized protein n=1 Tax=Ectopseudomonas oleovorans (strain CECT 5344) TaxID=1182590 RepID=W6R120_ECTO5|nr:DUF2786 domain-containing protein [Pseudomonas oleovorans]CDM42412.1 hypothetical protein BN5_3870 [Pseudomonas oleovorans CECT 5344]CDR93035.1 hypothetical protein PPSAL_3811 [Pseudomonas oleovorans]